MRNLILALLCFAAASALVTIARLQRQTREVHAMLGNLASRRTRQLVSREDLAPVPPKDYTPPGVREYDINTIDKVIARERRVQTSQENKR